MIIREPNTDYDYVAFMHLWENFLEESFAKGGDLPPSPRNLIFFSDLYRNYRANWERGTIVFAIDGSLGPYAGVGLWGKGIGESPLEFRYDKIAQGWGIYVLPEYRGKGISKLIRVECVKQLLARDFQVVIGSAAMGNDASYFSSEKFGFRPTHTQGILHLAEVQS